MDWPSLRLNFTIKRTSMQVFGQSAFTMVSNPIVSSDSSSVLYDAFATFTDESAVYNYTVVNGITYMSRNASDKSTLASSVKCIDPGVLPSINALVSAINEATAISSVSASEKTQCSSGKLFKVSVQGMEFALCFSGATGFTMRGSDMDIVVEDIDSHFDILAPTADAEKCSEVVSPSLISLLGRALLTGNPFLPTGARKLEATFEFSDLFGLDEPSCSCKSKRRPCIFLHGLGIGTEEPENLDSYPEYWGNMTDHAPCCTSFKYAMLNTLNNSWTSDTQQQKVCDHLLPVSKTSHGTVVSDTIVITHSMGGLMVAGALANKKCSFDKSTSWVATAAPMRGSIASDHFQDSCKDDTNILMETFVDQTGFCPPDDGIKSLAYEKGNYSNPELDVAYKAAQKVYQTKTAGVLCSNGYSGLLSSYQYQYWGLGLMVPHNTDENDGMVEFKSCAGGIPESKFGTSYRDRYYLTKVNHADAAFRADDAVLDEAKMPKKWFECLL
ncbi:hypothetical protein PHYBOEH_010925 [Phytophthora boehmeriae]|uniref:Uncharacterized protein n=1 Tax=Phytophthora boehmeriae TaxID=109152 RepID=A0A8T1VQ04_9STRA|nr:hypothetical protein PHYBOEH_010925 [Phytophthora boehmeriae]